MRAARIRLTAWWRVAAALAALVAAVVLVAWIGEAGTIVVVAPPVAVATLPLAWTGAGRARAAAVAAAVLAVWSLIGVDLLGLYFLPAAALLAVAAIRERPRRAPAGPARTPT
jgi:hypothetical protein